MGAINKTVLTGATVVVGGVGYVVAVVVVFGVVTDHNCC